MLHHVNPHAVHTVLADDVVVVVGEGQVGGQHGGWHMGWEAHTGVGGMYCAGENGQARWVNGQVGGRWVNGEGGCAVWFGVQEQCG